MKRKFYAVFFVVACLACLIVPVLASGAPEIGQVDGVRPVAAAGASSTDTPAVEGTPSVEETPTDTPFLQNGRFYYYRNGRMLKGGWITSPGGRRYFAGEDGALYTGFCTIGGESYYFSVKDAHMMRSGVVTGPRGRLYYASKDGPVLKDSLITGPGGRQYIADADGHLLRGGFADYRGQRYYVNKNGQVVKNQWVQVHGKWYYLQANGTLARNRSVGGYYVGADGTRAA